MIDECTMISQKMLSYADKWLKQITMVNKPFGELVVIMFRGPGQLLPAGANSLWVDICKEDHLPGFTLHN